MQKADLLKECRFSMRCLSAEVKGGSVPEAEGWEDLRVKEEMKVDSVE